MITVKRLKKNNLSADMSFYEDRINTLLNKVLACKRKIKVYKKKIEVLKKLYKEV